MMKRLLPIALGLGLVANCIDKQKDGAKPETTQQASDGTQQFPEPEMDSGIIEKAKILEGEVQSLLKDENEVPCIEEIQAYIDGKSKEVRRAWQECRANLNGSEARKANIALGFAKTKQNREYHYSGDEDAYQEQADALVDLLAQAGIDGWEWNEDYEVLESDDGSVLFPPDGYALELEDGNMIHLDPFGAREGVEVTASFFEFNEEQGVWTKQDLGGDNFGSTADTMLAIERLVRDTTEAEY